MKKLCFIILALLLLSACTQEKAQTPTPEESQPQEAVYVNITAQEAKEIMDKETGYIILDTRTQEEFDEKKKQLLGL